jgi:hypothetical protein
MTLPKIDKPLFDLHVPSMDKVAKFRPFVVKEEKILLIAQQSGQEKDIIQAIKQVVNNCVQEKGFDVDKLATFDLEYLFLKLRAKSVNNIIEVSYRDLEDDKVYPFVIDLDDVEMQNKQKMSNKIAITDSVGIVMKYPSVTILDNLPADASPTDIVEYLVRACIDCVYDEETVYKASDYTEDELTEFLDSLSIDTFNKIREFFDTLPQMYYKLEYKNSLGNERVIELTTLNDFFTWG